MDSMNEKQFSGTFQAETGSSLKGFNYYFFLFLKEKK